LILTVTNSYSKENQGFQQLLKQLPNRYKALQEERKVYFMSVLKKILGIFTGILAVTYFVMASNQEQTALFLILGIIMVVFTVLLFRPTKKDKLKKAEKLDNRQNSLKSCSMKHINGLPIAENVNCDIVSSDDKFTFSSGTMKFELDKSKITDVCIKTDREIQQQYVSSVGGAVGGAVLFGALGAMIGGRAKKKTVKSEVHNYLIITYESDEIKYIGFEIGVNMASANLFVNEFKNNHTSGSTYQL
jgi:hypothetical protein